MKTSRKLTIGETTIDISPAELVLKRGNNSLIKIAWKAAHPNERPTVPSPEQLAPGYLCVSLDVFVHEDGRHIDGAHTFEAIPESVGV